MVKLLLNDKFSAKNFIKSYKSANNKIVINFTVKNVPFTMDAFPHSREVLKSYLPSIFSCQCFNPLNQSFYKEAKNTEIGHLFEHILLEYMCLEKIQYTDEISYSGKTSWNTENMTGDFKIEVECGKSDKKIFTKALNKSIHLMDVILSEGKTISLNTQRKQTVAQAVSIAI